MSHNFKFASLQKFLHSIKGIRGHSSRGYTALLKQDQRPALVTERGPAGMVGNLMFEMEFVKKISLGPWPKALASSFGLKPWPYGFFGPCWYSIP